jgi:hypothetical protein
MAQTLKEKKILDRMLFDLETATKLSVFKMKKCPNELSKMRDTTVIHNTFFFGRTGAATGVDNNCLSPCSESEQQSVTLLPSEE